MSEQLPPRRRRIAGESARPTRAPQAKPVVRKPVATKRAEVKPAESKSADPKPVVPAAAAESASGASRGSARDLVALLVAAALLIGGGVLTVLGLDHWKGESFSEAREAAVSAASDSAETILSYRYDELDEHAEVAKALMTRAYAAEYDKTTAPALEEVAPQRKVTVDAVVRNAAAVPCGSTCSPDKATVILFVDLDRRIDGEDTVTVFGNRLQVELERSGGEWLVADVTGL